MCVQDRPEGGKPACAQRGGRELASALVNGMMKHEETWSEVSVTPTLCLGPCFDGPNVVVYPEGVWYARVQPEDVDELVTSHLAQGKTVERLRHVWPVDGSEGA